MNDKTDGVVPRSFIVEGKLPKQDSNEMSEYLVRRMSDDRAKISVMPYTAGLIAKMENEIGGESELVVPPRDRCFHLKVVTDDTQASQLEYLGLTLYIHGKRVPLKPLADSVERNETKDFYVSGGTKPLNDEDPRSYRVKTLREFESREIRCTEEPQALQDGFAIEVNRLYDVSLPKRWLRWSVVRPQGRVAPRGSAEAATVAPLGVVRRSRIK